MLDHVSIPVADLDRAARALVLDVDGIKIEAVCRTGDGA